MRGLFALYAEEKAREKQLTFDFHTDREKIYIQMDAIKLESILDNLLSNAVKYTPEGGSVTLRLEIPGEEKDVRISVSDTGIGVPVRTSPISSSASSSRPRRQEKRKGQVSDFIS